MDILHNTRPAALTGLDDVPIPSVDADAPMALLKRCPAAGQTPLVSAKPIAAQADVAEVWIKDERGRMGLGSFKALGAAYVIAHDAEQGNAKGATYVTASAGNHGMSVAAGAAAFGARAVVYIAQTVPEAFAARLADQGAEVVRAGETYEASMEAAAQAASDNGWRLLSDSSWEGYMEYPHRVMEGYLALMAEAIEQMEQVPSHIFLQAGVGGLAGEQRAGKPRRFDLQVAAHIDFAGRDVDHDLGLAAQYPGERGQLIFTQERRDQGAIARQIDLGYVDVEFDRLLQRPVDIRGDFECAGLLGLFRIVQLGAEFELRQTLRSLGLAGGLADELSFGFNLTLAESNISITERELEARRAVDPQAADTRDLQGHQQQRPLCARRKLLIDVQKTSLSERLK
mgnify:CR=1 FL=1